MDAQTNPPPLPAAFATAHTVFVANAGAAAEGINMKPAASVMYTSLLSRLAGAHRYQCVYSPADADLLLEISDQPGNAFLGNHLKGSGYLQLDIRDAKSHTLLWTLEEPVNAANRVKTLFKNIDEATGRLVDDFNKLAAGRLPDDAK
jgi:hypothetical protein